MRKCSIESLSQLPPSTSEMALIVWATRFLYYGLKIGYDKFSDGLDSHPPLPNNAGLAQQVEQLTCNEKVGSSILSSSTRQIGSPALWICAHLSSKGLLV